MLKVSRIREAFSLRQLSVYEIEVMNNCFDVSNLNVVQLLETKICHNRDVFGLSSLEY